MLSKKEIKLIKFIKYTPIFIVGIICLLITTLLSIEKNVSLKKDLENLQKDYLEKNREIIKNEVNKVFDYIEHKKLNSEDELKENLKDRVEEAFTLVNYIYEKYKNTETKEQIINRIKDSLRPIRFNDNRGYFYISGMDGINILHPINPEFENKLVINYKDNFGNFVLKSIINNLQNKKETFTTLYWQKPDDSTHQYKKITFNKIFEPYNFIIGTGEYLNDFENITKEEVLSYISTIRYDKNGYISVIDEKGVYLSHIEKSYIGVNRIDLKDENGVMITKEILNLAKDGNDGYLKYIGTIKPQTKLPSEKISYIKGFTDWNWAITTGFYTDELEKQIIDRQAEIKDRYTKNLTNLFLISFLLTGIFLSISFIFQKDFKKDFINIKNKFLLILRKIEKKILFLPNKQKWLLWEKCLKILLINGDNL